MSVIFFLCVLLTVIVLIVTKHIQVTCENTTRVYQNNNDQCVSSNLLSCFDQRQKGYTFTVDNEFQYRCNVGTIHCNIIIHVGKTILRRPIKMRLCRSRNENKNYTTEEDFNIVNKNRFDLQHIMQILKHIRKIMKFQLYYSHKIFMFDVMNPPHSLHTLYRIQKM